MKNTIALLKQFNQCSALVGSLLPRRLRPQFVHRIVLILQFGIVILTGGCTKERDAGNLLAKQPRGEENDPKAVAIFSTNIVAGEIISAGNFLRDLQLLGRLPGFTKGEHGNATAKEVTLSEPEQYPISRTFFATKVGDKSNSMYWYTFVRATKLSGWQLKKAWRTDAQGKEVEEFPVNN